MQGVQQLVPTEIPATESVSQSWVTGLHSKLQRLKKIGMRNPLNTILGLYAIDSGAIVIPRLKSGIAATAQKPKRKNRYLSTGSTIIGHSGQMFILSQKEKGNRMAC